MDHCVLVYEDTSYEANLTNWGNEKSQMESQWKIVFRNTHDHSNFIQGVAFDPLAGCLRLQHD